MDSAFRAAVCVTALVAWTGCDARSIDERDAGRQRHDAADDELDAALERDAQVDAYRPPVCRGAAQPCTGDEGCCGELTCGETMLGQVCCGDLGSTCASSADCCGDIPCIGDRCMAMCRPARQVCTGTECCSGLTCGTTSLGRTCCGQALTPCSTTDGTDCCGALLCGTTTAGRVCCGGSGASCSTADGRDCCGTLDCVSGRCT